MASQFGGKSYQPNDDGTMSVINGNTSLKGYWNAFVPGGKDVTDGENYKTAEGNQLGSWMMRLNLEGIRPFGVQEIVAREFLLP